MNTYHYCTVASVSHLPKVMILRNSLDSNCKDYSLSILCADEEVYGILSDKKWDNVKLVRAAEIEDAHLLTAKFNRSKWEYVWTLKPAFLSYVIATDPVSKYFASIDADICFFSDPNVIFDEAPEASLFLTDHNNSAHFLNYYDISGRFNSGFVGCKNCINAVNAIGLWKDKAINWCYARFDLEKKLYGDQRYLEELPKLFSGIHVINSKGVNAAHWNIENYKLSARDNKIYINEDELIFYHFSGLMMYSPTEFNLSWAIHIPQDAVDLIYMPYIRELYRTILGLQTDFPDFKTYGFQKPGSNEEMHYLHL